MRIPDLFLPAVRNKSEVGELRYDFSDYLAQKIIFGGQAYNAAFQSTWNAEPAERIADNFSGYVSGIVKQNGIVFACLVARMSIFTEAWPIYRRERKGRLGDYFSGPDLDLIKKPGEGQTSGDILGRALFDADIAGNGYIARIGGELVRLRPDWVEILLAPRDTVLGVVGWKKVGYAYYEGGNFQTKKPAIFLVDEVAHFAPTPDPDASYRGMSWITPVVREIMADGQATKHKLKFFENAATPNLAVKLPETISPEKYKAWVEKMKTQHDGVDNAYKTLYTGGGADVTVIGADLKQLDFKVTQGAGETRIASAARIHPVLVGLSEGMQGSALNAGNYNSARRSTADMTFRPLWRNFFGSMQAIIPTPPDAVLTFDPSSVAFLREDEKDIAEVQQMKASTIRTLVEAGFTADSVIAAVANEDVTLLVHSGLTSVQLQPPVSEEDLKAKKTKELEPA
jgi:hypothetical protein